MSVYCIYICTIITLSYEGRKSYQEQQSKRINMAVWGYVNIIMKHTQIMSYPAALKKNYYSGDSCGQF